MNSPNPDWKPGDKVISSVGKMLSIDPEEQSARSNYKLLIGSIVPRPIAFVSTISSAGVVNLSPFSFFSGVCSDPLTIMISVASAAGREEKDTLRNIVETGEFVVNSANQWLIEPLVHTAGEFAPEVNEMELVGLSALDSTKVKPPRVKESAIQFECQLYDKMQIGDGGPGSATIVIGKIVLVHVSEQLYEDGKIDVEALQPVGRLGGFGYCLVGKRFEIKVPRINR